MTAESKRLGQKGSQQSPLPVVTASMPYGCSLHYVWLLPLLLAVAASITYGCSFHHLRLQVHQLFNGGNYCQALQVQLLTTTCY